jgi:hypothetical protein
MPVFHRDVEGELLRRIAAAAGRPRPFGCGAQLRTHGDAAPRLLLVESGGLRLGPPRAPGHAAGTARPVHSRQSSLPYSLGSLRSEASGMLSVGEGGPERAGSGGSGSDRGGGATDATGGGSGERGQERAAVAVGLDDIAGELAVLFPGAGLPQVPARLATDACLPP